MPLPAALMPFEAVIQIFVFAVAGMSFHVAARVAVPAEHVLADVDRGGNADERHAADGDPLEDAGHALVLAVSGHLLGLRADVVR